MAVPGIENTPQPLAPGWSFLHAVASSSAQKRKAAQDLRCPVRNCKQACSDEKELDEHIIKEHPRSKAATDAKARLQTVREAASPQKSSRSPKVRNSSGVVNIAIDLELDEKPASETQVAIATASPKAVKQMPPSTAGQAIGPDAVHSRRGAATDPAQLDQQAANAADASDVATVPGTPPVSSSIDQCLAQKEAPAAAPGLNSGNDILNDDSDDDLLEACRLAEAKVGGTLEAPAPAHLDCSTASERHTTRDQTVLPEAMASHGTVVGTTQPAVLKSMSEETHPPNGAPVAAAGASQLHPFDQACAEQDIDAMLRDEEMMEQEMAFEAGAAEAQLEAMMKDTAAEKKPAPTPVSTPASAVLGMSPSGGRNASLTAGDGKCLTCGLYGHPTGSCLQQKTFAGSFGKPLAPQRETPTAMLPPAESGEFAGGGVSCFKCGRSGHLARECPCKCGFRCRWRGGPCQADQGAALEGGFVASTNEIGVSTQATADCFKCGNSGHWAKDCPCTCGYRCLWQGRPCQGASRATGSFQAASHATGNFPGAMGDASVPEPVAGRDCFKCGNSGHWARDCPCRCGYRCKSMGGPCPTANDTGGPMGGLGSLRQTSSLGLTNDFSGGSGFGLGASSPGMPASGGAFGDRGCFKCGQVGHWASACTGQAGGETGGGAGSGAGGGRSSSGGGACFRCGQEGHWSSQCPSRG
mmetsp:Transcript_22662/g.43412  ORF Transcript_22662/g.43412 Transcript_22662/m.43412 type:complete len:697 (-) Transcript_22662:176-2266(-)